MSEPLTLSGVSDPYAKEVEASREQLERMAEHLRREAAYGYPPAATAPTLAMVRAAHAAYRRAVVAQSREQRRTR